MNGSIDAAFINTIAFSSDAALNLLRPLAIAQQDLAPNGYSAVPPFTQFGIQFTTGIVFGVAVNPATPAYLQQQISNTIIQISNNTNFKEQINENLATVVGYNYGKALTKYIQSQITLVQQFFPPATSNESSTPRTPILPIIIIPLLFLIAVGAVMLIFWSYSRQRSKPVEFEMIENVTVKQKIGAGNFGNQFRVTFSLGV